MVQTNSYLTLCAQLWRFLHRAYTIYIPVTDLFISILTFRPGFCNLVLPNTFSMSISIKPFIFHSIKIYIFAISLVYEFNKSHQYNIVIQSIFFFVSMIWFNVVVHKYNIHIITYMHGNIIFFCSLLYPHNNNDNKWWIFSSMVDW